MERLVGKDLVALLRERPQIPLGEVEEIVRQVAEGLRVAHEEGVVHRDLKPANLYFAQSPGGAARWVVLDFGVSKLLSNDEATLTTDHVLGTPHYMAPEQAPVATGEKRGVDRRADLYALGMIAYRALTGQLAFGRGDMSDVIRALVHHMPADPRELRPELPEDVALWMRVAIAKNPDDRFADAREMSDAFADASRGELSMPYRARARALLAARGWDEQRDDTKSERRGAPRSRSLDVPPSSREICETGASDDSSSASAKSGG
jgi:serine/threonine-protein kinase